MTAQDAGTRIARARSERGLTQEELASILGVSWVTVSRWERGERYPAPDQRAKIRKTLDIELEDVEDET